MCCYIVKLKQGAYFWMGQGAFVKNTEQNRAGYPVACEAATTCRLPSAARTKKEEGGGGSSGPGG